MSVPTPSGWQYETPQYWESYLPQADDYDDAQGYIDALAAGAEDTSPHSGRYWDPIGQVWRGGRRSDQEIAVAKYDSGRYLDPNNSFNKGPYSQMRLSNRIGFNPDEARMAYDAHDEFGNPLLDPAILAYMEQALGIGPNERPEERVGIGDPREGGRERTGRDGGRGGDPEVPDSTRWRDWWNSGDATPPPIDTLPPGMGWNSEPGGETGSGSVNGRGAPPVGAAPPIIPPPTSGMMGPVAGDPAGEFGSGPAAGRSGLPATPPGTSEMSLAASTIDPRYPDFILRALNRKWGPRPFDGLGGY